MEPDRWRRVEALFHRAVLMTSGDRGALLDAECGEDPSLRAEVERLIAADEGSNELVQSFEDGALLQHRDPLIGRSFGAYRLKERIGAGGMGLVYRAERTDGLFQHEVAVKLIRIELATDGLVRRFEFERQTLAALQHPNIAQLHDGGTTEDGRPYLVMQLVRGSPIDRYCDEHALSIPERLRLFVQVCRGVQFAHQNLVVHRDLKPGNILIDESGVPKLLDFGLAQLLDAGANVAGTNPTLTGANILTPDYASPEQLTLGPVTTAMDVYSLGVVLYELLTGRRPFRSDSHSPIEWQRAVIERSPTRPSTVVVDERGSALGPSSQRTSAEIAARCGATPKSLQRLLRGDLDRIVLMALRKEPERRYASAKDFADDIERHFSGHPVLARGDSIGYRTTKFVRRNRLAVGSALALFVALLLGIVFALRGERHAEEQALHARIEAESFQGISEFLMDTFLTSAPTLTRTELDPRRQRIQLHAARLRRQYAAEDHLRANLLDSLGKVAMRLGFDEDAIALVEEARDIRSKAFGEESLEYALSLRSLGDLDYARGELKSAVPLLEKALALHRKQSNESHTDVASVANDLAACLRGLGRTDEARALHREALALRRSADNGSLPVAESLNNLANVELDRNDPQAAALEIEESLAIRRRILGDEHDLTMQSMSNLALTYWRLARRDEAYALLGEVEAGCRALHADGEDGLSRVLANRGGMLATERKFDEAEPLLVESIAIQERRLGPAHATVASTLSKLAQVQHARGRIDEARGSWQRVVAIRRDPAGSPRSLAQALYDYGNFLLATKEPVLGRSLLEEAITVLRANGQARAALTARAGLALGEAWLAFGDRARAQQEIAQAVSIFESAPQGLEPELSRARALLERCDAATAR